jgi:carboxyl-terminal processing protease
MSKGSLSSKVVGLTTQDISKLNTSYNLIISRYIFDINHDKIMTGAIIGMLSALDDPYSTYMNPEEVKQLKESTNSLFENIGVSLQIKDGKFQIFSLIKDSPAERARIRVNDIIASVNGEALDGLTLDQACTKICGMKGTHVRLGILRIGVNKPIDIIVIRDNIQMETVSSNMLTDDIGKIELRQFSLHTFDEFKTSLVRLDEKKMKGLIIDVRDNPGGNLDTVLRISELFIEEGKIIIQTENQQGKRYIYVSKNKNTVRKYPIVVLINKGSASAAEIMAVALQQSAGSKLIGETTYGKGTIQDIFDKQMGDGSYLKLTINKWLTPSGTWINKKGINPDLYVVEPAYFKTAPLSKKTILKYDMNGDDVRNMQIMLNGLDLNPERMDGYFSENTTLAVENFQRLHDLPVTGEADIATMNKLEKEIIAKINEPNNDSQLNAAIKIIQKESRS